MIQQIYPTVPHPYAYELNKDLQFAAAHRIPSDQAGKCRELHGHTYFANITVAGDELDESGFLINFAVLKQLIHDRFDHTVLNEDTESFSELEADRFPTTEVVARTICELARAACRYSCGRRPRATACTGRRRKKPMPDSLTRAQTQIPAQTYTKTHTPTSSNASPRIPVLEVFGPTVQGEGMVIGRKTMFVRTAGCDYSCAWCDSAFTWDGTGKADIRMLTADEVYAELRSIGGEAFAHVTLSGGNPALLPQLGSLIELLRRQGLQVALETQGSRWQDWFLQIDDLTLSPKPPSSGMTTNWSALDEIIRKLEEAGRSFSLKVVVFDEADLQFAADVHTRYPQVPFYAQAGNGRLQETEPDRLLPYLLERYAWLIDRVMAHHGLRQVHVLPQLHTWVWGNKKGV
jgi:7-carboxy-7-deazaguanine synthase